jgi:hypothetical protein
MRLSFQTIILVTFIVAHNILIFNYTHCIAGILPAFFMDYIAVLNSKMGQFDAFSFYISVTHYFLIKILLAPLFLFCQTHDLFGIVNCIKDFAGLRGVPARSILANFCVYSYFTFKYIFFFKLYVQMLKIQFSIFKDHKIDKEKEILHEFELDNNEYKYLFLKREIRFRLLVLQVFFSVIYFIIAVLLLVLFNAQTSNTEYYIRVVVEMETNPMYLLRYGHYYR